MPLFMGLFTLLVPLLRFFSGAAALVIIYDLLIDRMVPLFTLITTKLTGEVSTLGGGGGASYLGSVFTFFDISRGLTVLTSAVVVAIFWKLAFFAAKSMAARAAPGL